jgi:hypothetical protein
MTRISHGALVLAAALVAVPLAACRTLPPDVERHVLVLEETGGDTSWNKTIVERRRRAIDSLGELGPRAHGAIPTLLDVMLRDAVHRYSAREAIIRIGPIAEEALVQVLVDREVTADVMEEVKHALKRVREEKERQGTPLSRPSSTATATESAEPTAVVPEPTPSAAPATSTTPAS